MIVHGASNSSAKLRLGWQNMILMPWYPPKKKKKKRVKNFKNCFKKETPERHEIYNTKEKMAFQYEIMK